VAAAAHRLTAEAAVRVENVSGRNVVTTLRSETPLALRIARSATPGPACLTQVSTAAGPLRGDRLRLRVEAAENAGVVLRSTGAAVVQPGPGEQPSSSAVLIRAGEGSTVDHQPQATVVAADALHEQVLEIDYENAAILAKETVVLGRHQQPPGSCVLRTRVRRGGRTVLASSVGLGPLAPAGWDALTGTAGYRCLMFGLTTQPLASRTELSAEGWGAVHVLDCGLRSVTVLSSEAVTADAVWGRLMRADSRDSDESCMTGSPTQPTADARTDRPEDGSSWCESTGADATAV
jgi:urease accessory protein